MRGLLLFAVMLASCYNPDLSNGMYTCTKEEPVCPDGQYCIDNLCRFLGEKPPARDMATVPADMASPTGCASKRGASLGPKAWACPGKYAPGKVGALCAPGYAICTSSEDIDLALCKGVLGFYIANVRGYDERFDCDPYRMVHCNYMNQQERPLWFGCGGSPLSFVQTCLQSCSGFNQALNGTLAARAMPITFIDSFTPQIEDQRNDDELNGVLCCTK